MMKKIGLLGGMSWESSLEYYRNLNEMVKNELGGSHSANCIMHSFDFQEIEDLQNAGKWDALTQLMVEEALNLKSCGAECIVICTNTMHLMAPAIEEKTDLKVVHIADATGDEIRSRKIDKVLLLGTKFTMEGTFYRDKLESKGIEVLIPNREDRQCVHDVIYNELVRGVISEDSRSEYIKIINKMAEQGAKGVVLGCTEIPLLISPDDVEVEVFDTTYIHSKAVVTYSLKNV